MHIKKDGTKWLGTDNGPQKFKENEIEPTVVQHSKRDNFIEIIQNPKKNFDKRPKGFRKWEVSADTLLHSFVALEAQQVADPAPAAR